MSYAGLMGGGGEMMMMKTDITDIREIIHIEEIELMPL